MADQRTHAAIDRRRSNAAGPHPLARDKGTRADMLRVALQDQDDDVQDTDLTSTSATPAVEAFDTEEEAIRFADALAERTFRDALHGEDRSA